MGISFGGINTGLPPNLVEQLIEAERIPVRQMEAQKGKSESRLTLVKDLESKVAAIRGSIGDLASARGFQDVKLMSGDPNIVQGVVDPQLSKPGSWNVEVMQLAQKAAAITNGFPDRDQTEIGIGYFKFKTADGYREVYINGKSSTLDGAANAINNSGLGVRASIINDRKNPDAPYKLVISADAVGSDNTVEYPTLYFMDGDQDLYFDETREAANGIVKIDGFEFEIADNTVKDMIPGVTLDLKQAAPGKTVNVTVKEDLEVVTGKVKSFVDAMNGVLGFIQQQNQMNEKTDTSSTLGGDSLLRSIENRLRQLIQRPVMGVGSEIRNLSQIGIQFNRSGLLEYNQEKFNSTLAKSPDSVSRFLAGDGFATGFIPSLRREVGTILDGAFGPLANRRRGLTEKINQIDRRIETKEKQLERREQQLRSKFSKLEETMSRLKSQGAALGAVGGGGFNLAGGGGG